MFYSQRPQTRVCSVIGRSPYSAASTINMNPASCEQHSLAAIMTAPSGSGDYHPRHIQLPRVFTAIGRPHFEYGITV